MVRFVPFAQFDKYILSDLLDRIEDREEEGKRQNIILNETIAMTANASFTLVDLIQNRFLRFESYLD